MVWSAFDFVRCGKGVFLANDGGVDGGVEDAGSFCLCKNGTSRNFLWSGDMSFRFLRNAKGGEANVSESEEGHVTDEERTHEY